MDEMIELLDEGPASAISQPALLLAVRDAFGLPDEQAAEFGWKLLARAADGHVVDARGKLPLAAARYLLDLVELPLDAHTALPELAGRTWHDLHNLSAKVFDEVPPRLPLREAQQRRMLAVLAAGYGRDGSNLSSSKPRLREIAGFLLDSFVAELENPVSIREARKVARHHRSLLTPKYKRPLVVLPAVLAAAALCTWGISALRGDERPDYKFSGSLTAADTDGGRLDEQDPTPVRSGETTNLHLKFKVARSNPPIPSLRVLLRYQEPEEGQTAFMYASADPLPTFDYDIDGAHIDLEFDPKKSCGFGFPRAGTAVPMPDTRMKSPARVEAEPVGFQRNVGLVTSTDKATITLRDVFAAYTIHGVSPGEVIELNIPVTFDQGDDDSPAYLGNALDFRDDKSDEYKRNGTASKGDRLRFRLGVNDGSCSTKPADLLVRVAVKDSDGGFSRLSAVRQ